MTKPKDAARKAAERYMQWCRGRYYKSFERDITKLARLLRAAKRAGAKEVEAVVTELSSCRGLCPQCREMLTARGSRR